MGPPSVGQFRYRADANKIQVTLHYTIRKHYYLVLIPCHKKEKASCSVVCYVSVK